VTIPKATKPRCHFADHLPTAEGALTAKVEALEKALKKAEAVIAAKTQTITIYDAVTNAMPGYMVVAVSGAHIAAHNGADKAALAALVSEDGLAATKAKLAAPKVYFKTAGEGHSKPAVTWPQTLTSTCSHCGKAIPVGASYATIIHQGSWHSVHAECVEVVLSTLG
jgi:hypothetical protein